jgi:hypothetical protein
MANLLLSRNVTLGGKLRNNEPEIPALFLIGKQREVCSSTSILGFTNDQILVSHLPTKNKAVIFLSSQHHDDTFLSEEKDRKLLIIM